MTDQPSTKRLKSESSSSDNNNNNMITIGTHSGHFHADEALAVYMLRLLPAYRSARLVRTRDPETLARLHTVVDVGGDYDPSRNRFDHHQRTFDATFPGRPTKLSSAGLVYLHFGKAILAQALSAAKSSSSSSSSSDASAGGTAKETPVTVTVTEDDADVTLLHPKIYESFIEALDAHDNGISKYDPKLLEAAGVERRFSSGGFDLGAMVGRFNRNWNDPPPTKGQEEEDARFELASQRIGEEFSSTVDYYCRAWIPARDVVAKAFNSRFEADPEGRIMVLRGTSAPWKDHLYTLEEKADQKGKLLYVLYPEKPVEGAKWRIQCVPESSDSFASRKPLPEAWRGARDTDLDNISGVAGCVFVHASGFIGGNATFEGAMEMTKKALAI